MVSRRELFLKKITETLGPSLVSELTKEVTSKTVLDLRCPVCSCVHQSTFSKIQSRTKMYPHLSTECKRCSRTISRQKTKETIEKRYGKHYMKLPEFKRKVAATNIKKYGGVAPVFSDEVKRKMRSTNLERYGSANAQADPRVKSKVRKTSLKRYGVEHHTKASVSKRKRKDTCVKKYGVDNPAKVRGFVVSAIKTKGEAVREEVLPKIIQDLEQNPDQIISSKSFQEKHNIYYVTAFRWLREEGLDHLIPRGHQASSLEDDFYRWLTQEYSGEILRNNRDALGNLELDLWLPEKRLGIELNGLFWHSEYKKPRDYHFKKRVLAQSKGIALIQINQDEWESKRPIVKSMVRVKLGRVRSKINARDTSVRVVKKREAELFLSQNHLMGPSYGTSNLGLYYEDKLVSLATYKNTKERVELVRFCSLLDTVVVGGLSKLLSRFPKGQIISFVDLRYATGHSLEKLGFKLSGVTLGWKWTDFYTTYNRRYCRANMDERGLSEAEHAKKLQLSKIYDAGQAKWVL